MNAPEFKRFHSKRYIQARPYIRGEDLANMYVPEDVDPDTDRGYIVEDPSDNLKLMYVSKSYFEEHYARDSLTPEELINLLFEGQHVDLNTPCTKCNQTVGVYVKKTEFTLKSCRCRFPLYLALLMHSVDRLDQYFEAHPEESEKLVEEGEYEMEHFEDALEYARGRIRVDESLQSEMKKLLGNIVPSKFVHFLEDFFAGYNFFREDRALIAMPKEKGKLSRLIYSGDKKVSNKEFTIKHLEVGFLDLFAQYVYDCVYGESNVDEN